MTETSVTSVFPGPIRQFGFIVTDLDEAIRQWAALGVGPWALIRDVPMTGWIYRGEPSEPVISIGLANSGDMQIELIQQHDDAPSPYKEFLDATGGGYNQVAYWVDDFDSVHEAAMAAGWTEVWRGGTDDGGRFAYYEHPDSPVPIVEVSAYSPGSAPFNDVIRDAAASWKPGDPILLDMGG